MTEEQGPWGGFTEVSPRPITADDILLERVLKERIKPYEFKQSLTAIRRAFKQQYNHIGILISMLGKRDREQMQIKYWAGALDTTDWKPAKLAQVRYGLTETAKTVQKLFDKCLSYKEQMYMERLEKFEIMKKHDPKLFERYKEDYIEVRKYLKMPVPKPKKVNKTPEEERQHEKSQEGQI